jgi:UrcA family protein
MTRYLYGAALAAVALICGGTANAQPNTSRQDVMIVRLSDLDTGHAAGAEAALHRIHRAAAKFCGFDGSIDLGQRFDQDKCVAKMTAKAVQTLGEREVTALYDSKYPSVVDPIGALELASRDPR